MKLQRPIGSRDFDKKVATLVTELLASSTVIHITHLSVTGPGSYAAHKALNEYYDGIVDLGDSIAEQYQGIIEKPLDYTEVTIRIITTVEGAIEYLKDLYWKVKALQANCEYSEISNQLDEVKSLIDSTKYKLVLLR